MHRTTHLPLASSLLVVIGAVAACAGGVDVDDPGSATQAIYNGEPTADFPAAAALLAGNAIRCTATLITPRIVLTAAHCVDLGAQMPPGGFGVFFGTDPSAAGGGIVVPMIKEFIHPDWVPEGDTYDEDIALIVLEEEPAGITPTPLFDGPLNQGFLGDPVTLVGFGHANDQNTFGIKRKVASNIDWITQYHVHFEGPAGTCSGDSGGPTFIEEDGETKVLSVHSTVSGLCGTLSNDVRVDAHRGPNGFLTTTIAEIEAILATEPEPEPAAEPEPAPEPEPSDEDDDETGDDDDGAAGCAASGTDAPALALALLLALARRRR